MAESTLPEWAQNVSPEVVELCKLADNFLGAVKCNAMGFGAGSGMMNAAEDRARIELERAYDRIPRRFKTEAFARLHDALGTFKPAAASGGTQGGAEPVPEGEDDDMCVCGYPRRDHHGGIDCPTIGKRFKLDAESTEGRAE